MRNVAVWGGSSEMMDIDAALRRLRELPVDPRLEQIDSAVMEAVVFQRRHGTPLPGTAFGVAAVFALSIGLFGSVIPTHETRPTSIAPLGAPSALAPSTLLGASE